MVFIDQKKINRSKLGEAIYLIYFALMLGIRACGFYDGQFAYNVVLVLGIALFATKMIVTKHLLKEYVFTALILLVSMIVYLHTGEKGLFVCFTMMLGMKDVSTYKVIKTGAIVAGVIILTKIFLGVFGIVPEIYYPQERSGAGMMFRHALGYAHPNTLHMNVLILSMMVTYLFTKVLKTYAKRSAIAILLGLSLLVFAFNFYIFQYSGSRTGILACGVYLFINGWLFVRRNIGVFEKCVSFLAFPLVCLISIGLPFMLKGNVFDFVNRTIFTTRFTIARYFWDNNKLTFFGIRLKNPDPQYATYGIDMAQLYLLLQLGLVAFALIAVLSFFYVYMSIRIDLREELAVYVGMLFVGIWEPLLYNLGFKNFTFVFLGAMVYAALNNDEKYLKDEDIDTKIFNMKTVLYLLMGAAFVGTGASFAYMSATAVPTALYGDRQESESGDRFGMEELYFTESDIEQMSTSGDLIVGYVDENHPMYQYSQEIAVMEYDKKIMSVGVFSGIGAMLFLLMIIFVKSHVG